MLIHHLFPEPAYFSKLDRTLTKKELKTINEYKKKTTSNAGNMTSSENYVLENKALNNLKKDLHTKVMDYFDKVICTDNLITPYITQSWINYLKNNQFHHQHNHQNSLISGVFYISADKEVDSITFHKAYPDDKIKLNINKYNMFNATSFKFRVETGNILLFPSSLAHGVEKKKKGNNIRTSLSFNVFFKGTVGNKNDLTELIIK